MARRVVITGIGVISSLGCSGTEFWENCIAGKTIVKPIPEHWRAYADYRCTLWSPLPEIDYTKFDIGRVDKLQHDPVTLLALCAAHTAIEDAKLTAVRNNSGNYYSIKAVDSRRAGVFMGTGIGGIKSSFDHHTYHLLSRPRKAIHDALSELQPSPEPNRDLRELLNPLTHIRRYNPLVVSMLMPNAVSAALGIRYSIFGPNHTTSLACTSSTTAVGEAFRAIQANRIDTALAGGAEYLCDQNGGIFYGFDAAKALIQDCSNPETSNRPFDAQRSGFLFSEGGAAVLVLEELHGALKRGARIWAEITGFAESFDAYSMMSVAPDGAQIERMIDGALKDAGNSPSEIDYINAHGTGTQLNDATECKVLERKFGSNVFVNSTKSLIGHTIGASGAIEIAVTALSIWHQTTHVCKNLTTPIANLNFVQQTRPITIERALTHSFAFGGHNAGIVLQRFD